MKKNDSLPRLPARILCWIAAFLLTAAIALTVTGAAGMKMMTSAELYTGTANRESVLRAQMGKITAVIDELALGYNFSAEEVKAAFSQEELEELNQEMAEWWNLMLTEGDSDTMPEWSAYQIQEIVENSMRERGINEATAYQNSVIVTQELEKTVRDSSLPLRGSLLSRLFEFINKRVKWEDAVRYLQKLPGLGLAACALLAGVIALLCAGKIRAALKYFGAVMGGAGISLLFAVVLIRLMKIGEMIGEASPILAEQYGAITGSVKTECYVIAGVLLTAGFFCLYLYGKKEQVPSDGEEA